MRARVLEVTDKQIYLEVEQQLRFKAPYVLRKVGRKPTSADDVEFHFSKGRVRPSVIIEGVMIHLAANHR